MATTEDADLTKDDIFDLLSNHRRRYVLHHCKQVGEPVTLSDLAEHVAARELGKEVEELTSDERKRVYTSLQQTHLPTLDDAGMITYEDHEIELTERAETLEVYMDVVPEGSISWGAYYLGLSGIGAAILGGVWLEILPTDPLPELGWAALVLALFAGSAAYHYYSTQDYRLGVGEQLP